MLIRVNAVGARPGPILPSGVALPMLELLQVFTHQILGAGLARLRQNGTPIRGRSEGGRSEECWPAVISHRLRARGGEFATGGAGNARSLPMLKRRRWLARTVGAVVAAMAGSAGLRLRTSGLADAERDQDSLTAPVIPNPLVVPSGDFENVWNKTVAVVDKYFDLESENRLSRTIRTQPRNGRDDA